MSRKVNRQDWATFYEWPTGSVLAFDQSLANTGWALVRFAAGHRPRIEDSGKITTQPGEGAKGFHDSLARGDNLFALFGDLFARLAGRFDVVVHEMPAMMSMAKSSNREAPIVAAMALRCARQSRCLDVPLEMVEIQRCKATLTGLPRAEKHQVREAVQTALGLDTWRTNEHITDAVALAITGAVDGYLNP